MLRDVVVPHSLTAVSSTFGVHMISIRRVAAACLFATVVGTPQPAHAADVFMEANDSAGDVRIFETDGLRGKLRRSIDLRRAWISEVDNRTYRVSAKIKDLAPKSTRWDQMVFFDAQSEKGKNYASIGFTHQSNDGAYAYDSKADEWCDIKRVTRRPAQGVLSVKVPLRCMPWDGWTMKVATYTGTFRSDAPAFSRDRMRLGKFSYPE
jgi:hypothetical protein